jgi:hypothetical protein
VDALEQYLDRMDRQQHESSTSTKTKPMKNTRPKPRK